MLQRRGRDSATCGYLAFFADGGGDSRGDWLPDYRGNPRNQEPMRVPVPLFQCVRNLHGGTRLSAQRSVLIVDESPENREVLRVALQRRGATIFEADRAQQGLRLIERHLPDLIVLDLDTTKGDTTKGDTTEGEIDTGSSDLGQSAQERQIPIVVLGTLPHQSADLPTGEFVSKPYHYGPLISRIEGLLNRTPSCGVR